MILYTKYYKDNIKRGELAGCLDSPTQWEHTRIDQTNGDFQEKYGFLSF